MRVVLTLIFVLLFSCGKKDLIENRTSIEYRQVFLFDLGNVRFSPYIYRDTYTLNLEKKKITFKEMRVSIDDVYGLTNFLKGRVKKKARKALLSSKASLTCDETDIDLDFDKDGKTDPVSCFKRDKKFLTDEVVSCWEQTHGFECETAIMIEAPSFVSTFLYYLEILSVLVEII